MPYDELMAPLKGCEQRISYTERTLSSLETKFVGLENLLKLQMDRVVEDRNELRAALTSLMLKLEQLAEADLTLSKALAKSEAQWSLTRWFLGASLVIMLPFLSFTVPIIIKQIALPAESRPNGPNGPKYGTKYGSKYPEPPRFQLHPTIPSYDQP